MMSISLTDHEANLLKQSINHCLETCKDGGADNGCEDCNTLQSVLKKFPAAQ